MMGFCFDQSRVGDGALEKNKMVGFILKFEPYLLHNELSPLSLPWVGRREKLKIQRVCGCISV